MKFIALVLFIGFYGALSLAQNCECSWCTNVPCSAPASAHWNSNCNVVKNRNASTPKVVSSSPSIEQMVVQEFYSNLIANMFKPANKTQELSEEEKLRLQREAELNKKRLAEMMERQKRYNDSIAQARHDRMMKDYKPLDDSSQGVAYKTLENMTVEYKGLEGGSMEESSDLARKQFEMTGDDLREIERRHPTEFFGDNMSEYDIQTLDDPESNPEIVDLRESVTYLSENIKNDSATVVQLLREHDPEGLGEPINENVKPDINCQSTARVLNGYYNQREQLFKSIQLSASEYENWKGMKEEAMENQVKEGFAYFLGELSSTLERRGKAADRLQGMLTKNKDRLLQEGADITQMESKINRLRKTAMMSNFEHLTAINDWSSFVKDGFSALIIELNVSNEEITAMIKDPQFEGVFTAEAPILNTLLDITSLTRDYQLFGKAIAKKIPHFALAQFAVGTSFNFTQMVVSYKQMIEAEHINGKLLVQSQQIQSRINELTRELTSCTDKN